MIGAWNVIVLTSAAFPYNISSGLGDLFSLALIGCWGVFPPGDLCEAKTISTLEQD